MAERTQFRRDRVVVPIARKHLLPDPLFFRCHLADDPVRQANDLVGQRIRHGAIGAWKAEAREYRGEPVPIRTFYELRLRWPLPPRLRCRRRRDNQFRRFVPCQTAGCCYPLLQKI
jgi:hypothetical protein